MARCVGFRELRGLGTFCSDGAPDASDASDASYSLSLLTRRLLFSSRFGRVGTRHAAMGEQWAEEFG